MASRGVLYAGPGWDGAMSDAVDIEVIEYVDVVKAGSSEDGRDFILQAQDQNGQVVNLSFPHALLPQILHFIANEAPDGRDENGDRIWYGTGLTVLDAMNQFVRHHYRA